MNTFNEYQEFTKSLATYNEEVWLYFKLGPERHEIHLNGMYPILALAEEAGEVAGKLAKYIRKSATKDITKEHLAILREDLKKELGDVAYQLSEAARQIGCTLQEIIDGNVEKLTDRKERGVIVGEGDNR